MRFRCATRQRRSERFQPSTLVRPARVDGTARRREPPALLVTTLAVPAVLLDGSVQRTAETAQTAVAASEAGGLVPLSRFRRGTLALIGLGVLLLGGNVFVSAATNLAKTWGMSERMVGLTIVAVGTSLPELATAIIAAARGNSDIAALSKQRRP